MADDLNRDIAELLGWTHIDDKPMNSIGQIWACSPNGKYGILPKYDTDPAACLELLQHVLSSQSDEHLHVGEMGQAHSGRWYCGLETMNAELVTWQTGDTLPEAIARACLAALRAVREGQTP